MMPDVPRKRGATFLVVAWLTDPPARIACGYVSAGDISFVRLNPISPLSLRRVAEFGIAHQPASRGPTGA
jgi:hypothetical protein